MDECARVETGGGVEPREGGDAESGIGGDVVGRVALDFVLLLITLDVVLPILVVVE